MCHGLNHIRSWNRFKYPYIIFGQFSSTEFLFPDWKLRFTNKYHYVDICFIYSDFYQDFIMIFFHDWSMKFCSLWDCLSICNLEGLLALWVPKYGPDCSPFLVWDNASLCCTWGIFPSFLVFIHSFFTRNVLFPMTSWKIYFLFLCAYFHQFIS